MNNDIVEFTPIPAQAKVLMSNARFIFASAGQRGGKEIEVNTPVMTPDGFVLAKDVNVGDTLFAKNGEKTKVTGVFNHSNKQLYKITFDDGSTVDCGLEHLWVVQTRRERCREKYETNHNGVNKVWDNPDYGKWKVVDTKEIYEFYQKYNGIVPAKQKYIIPLVDAIQFDNKDVTLNPYFLGAYLGNGYSCNSLSTNDPEILDFFGVEYKFKRDYDYSIYGVSSTLKELGLGGKRSWEKFIPEVYKINSPEIRLEVLRGLFDTDGSISDGKIEYSTSSKVLANDIKFLIESLGGKCVIGSRIPKFTYKDEKKTGRLSYRIHLLYIPVNPFKVKRKSEQFADFTNRHLRDFRRIVSIDKSVIADAVCFEVDHPSATYVINDFIVTHNTTTGCFWAAQRMQIPNVQGMICANTWDQLNQSTLAKFFDTFPHLRKYWIKRDKMVVIPTGPDENGKPTYSKIFLRSMDMPELIRGLNLHWFWADESDGLDESKWKILEGRTGSTKGQGLCTSSIYSRSFTYEMYRKFKDNPDYEFVTWTSKENPSFPPDEYERLKATWDPIDFEREFGGQFSFANGLVYPGVEEFTVDGYPVDSKPVEYIFGLDYGINDPTAITVSTVNTDGNWYIIDEHSKPGMSIQEINQWLKFFIDKYHRRPYATYQDPAGGVARLSLIQECRPRDAEKSIPTRIHMIRGMIYQHKLFVFKNCTNTIREFKNYQFDRKKPELPEDRNNHCMDSMGMAIENSWSFMQLRAKPEEDKEIMTPYWTRKFEAGIYKGNGKLEDKSRDRIDFEEGLNNNYEDGGEF
jgi:phage terminase large subunit